MVKYKGVIVSLVWSQEMRSRKTGWTFGLEDPNAFNSDYEHNKVFKTKTEAMKQAKKYINELLKERKQNTFRKNPKYKF